MGNNAIWLWSSTVFCHRLINTNTGIAYCLTIPTREDSDIPLHLSLYSMHTGRAGIAELFANDQAVKVWAQLKSGINGGIKAKPESPYAGLVGWLAGRLEEAQQALARWTTEKEARENQENMDADMAADAMRKISA